MRHYHGGAAVSRVMRVCENNIIKHNFSVRIVGEWKTSGSDLLFPLIIRVCVCVWAGGNHSNHSVFSCVNFHGLHLKFLLIV